ncbi:MAG: proteasome assembly chaperone family protein [Nitrososphaerota archaeon]|nr:proteasome assembly chaperone family protein [Nitrososphaerota archaeon]
MPSAPQRVQIVDTGPKGNKPTVIVGVPEAGLVGTIASSYLVEQLKLEERGFIDSDLMPPVMVVHSSVVRYPLHIFGKGNLIVVLSEVPLVGRLAVEVSKEVAAWAKSLKADRVVGISGAPSNEREQTQGDGKSAVVGVGNDQESIEAVKASGALPFEDGVISGFYASLMKYCTRDQQSAVVLLAESLAQFPDPGAAVSIIDSLNKLLSLKVDTKPLVQEAEGIRLRTRELMQQTQQAQQQPGATSGGSAYR